LTSKKIKIRLINSYVTSTISLTLVLLLISLLFLVIFNANGISKKTKESLSISLILKTTATEAEITEIIKKIDAADYCLETKYITKEDAANELTQELGEDFESILEYNPLPASIDLKLVSEYANLDSINSLETILKQESIISDVFFHRALINTVSSKLKVLSTVISLLGILIFFIAIFLINNTIRLSLYSKRFIIKTMQLVGATSNFIMKPFLIKSLIHGIISSFISILILILFIIFLQNNIEGLIKISYIGIVFFITLFFGILVTVISTYLSVNQYINTEIDNLYY